jgi:poly(A) polymerase
MRVVELVPAETVVRWAALLHDIAKPVTRTHEPDGRPRFFHHEEIGAGMAREILHGLRYPNEIVRDVVLLIETHMQLHGYSPDWKDGAVRRLMLRLGRTLPAALALTRADADAHSLIGTSENASRYKLLQERIETLGDELPERLRSPLSGDDLMQRYGRPPGPWIGRVKAVLETELVEGNLRPDDAATAWELADELVRAESLD